MFHDCPTVVNCLIFLYVILLGPVRHEEEVAWGNTWAWWTKDRLRSNQIVNTSVASNRLAEGVSDSSCPPASRRCLSVKGCWRWREAISDSWHAENKPVVIVVWICYFAIYLFIKLQSFFLSEFYTWSFVMVVLLFLITFIHVRVARSIHWLTWTLLMTWTRMIILDR